MRRSQIQTVFKAGNSNVVTIPTEYLKELGLKTGAEVEVEKDAVNSLITIKKVEKPRSVEKSKTSKEFKKWLDDVLKEDKEILDELANR